MRALTKNFAIFVSLALFTLVSPNCFAELKTELSQCLKIGKNQARLECYDVLAGGVNNQQAAIKEVIPAAPIAPKKPNSPSKSVSKIATEEAAKEPSSDFGMEFANQDEKVESFLVGEFTSWKKGMKLKLKNGQVWKVLSAKSGYRKMSNPAITISRGFFGSFNAKVEGLNAKAKVKRIK